MRSKETIGDRIYKIRKERNLSQEDLANMIGVSRQIISRWESNLSVPLSDKLKIISEKLNINYDELLNGTVMENKKRFSIIKYMVLLLLFIVIEIIVIVIYSNIDNGNEYKCLGTQTYYIDKIYDSDDNNYSYVTLVKNDIVKTVKVKRVISNNIEVNNTYEFVFRSNTNNDDIDYIFNSNEIINVIQSNKEIDKQINDIKCNN